jgi:hypothetical protein
MNIYDFTCDFVKVDHNEYRCSTCGIIISYAGLEKPIMICPKKISLNNPENYGIRISDIQTKDTKIEQPPSEPPSLMQKVLNFTKSATKHAMVGSPKCTDEQIHHRYNICTQCEFFQNNICTKCGCNLVREKIYMNKLAWADQSCPIGKWGPIDEEPKS